jgi:UDP-N-acetylmuramoylalanine--D-glutamate ligase
MTRKNNVIVGLGETGLSYARFLAARGEDFVVADDNPCEANVVALDRISPGAIIGNISVDCLLQADEIFISPGVPLGHEAVSMARASGKILHGDIQLFGELATAPIIGITGTNGKSTVSSFVFELIRDQGKNVSLAGNIGTPCLDVLAVDVDFHVLEISSYQLELATAMKTEISVVLNLVPDHMDRYANEQDYYRTKLGLYDNAKRAVINRSMSDDLGSANSAATFGSDMLPGENNFGISVQDEQTWLVQGNTILLSGDELQISGTHNFQNILAGLAIGWLVGLDMRAMLDTARRFKGLPHRSEIVGEVDGVTYVNDSKATNPGALVATVKGQARGRNIHLIAGGDSKGLGFDGLSAELGSYLKGVYLIGANYAALQSEFSGQGTIACDVLAQAVSAAAARATDGDIVLLSPGCASHDQYQNYVERGDSFKDLVGRLKS